MEKLPRWVGASVRVYKTLLKAYPLSFRKDYENEMMLVFCDLMTDAYRQKHIVGLLSVWLRVLGDLAWTAPKEHFHAYRKDTRGLAMGIKSLLTRELTPNLDMSFKAQIRRLVITLVPCGLLFGGLTIGKLLSMNLTEPQLFGSILVVSILELQLIAYGMLIPLEERKYGPKYYLTIGTLVLYVTSILLLILGVWKLASMAITEYELIVGLLLLFVLMMTLIGLAQIVLVIRIARAKRNAEEPNQPRSEVDTAAR